MLRLLLLLCYRSDLHARFLVTNLIAALVDLVALTIRLLCFGRYHYCLQTNCSDSFSDLTQMFHLLQSLYRIDHFEWSIASIHCLPSDAAKGPIYSFCLLKFFYRIEYYKYLIAKNFFNLCNWYMKWKNGRS